MPTKAVDPCLHASVPRPPLPASRSALPGTVWSHPALGLLLVPGRLLAAAVELWVIGQHMAALLGQDVQQQQQ